MPRERLQRDASRRFCRPTAAAKKFDVDLSTIWRWAKDGVLPPPRRIGGITGWWEDELEHVPEQARK